MAGKVDVLRDLRKIADGEGDIELMAIRAMEVVGDLIRAADSIMDAADWPDGVMVAHAELLRAALANVR